MSKKTFSEDLFEKYLSNHGIVFERIAEAAGPVPDYRLCVQPEPVIVEVKEFDRLAKRASTELEFDFVSLIREKIKSARRKFGSYTSFQCCVVLHDRQATGFLRSEGVLRAMFGERHESLGPDAYRFSGLAEMRPHQNTRISAVISLFPGRAGSDLAEFLARRYSSGTATGNLLSIPAVKRGIPSLDACVRSGIPVRAVVVENPFAKRPLSGALFNGPFDDRWARVDDGSFRLVFSGVRIAEMRSELPESSLRSLGF